MLLGRAKPLAGNALNRLDGGAGAVGIRITMASIK